MKKKWISRATITGLLLLGAAGVVFADSGTGTDPGSANDPLVTKSYVDSLFRQLGGKLPAPTTPTAPGTPSAPAGDTSAYATKAYVDQAISNKLKSLPSTNPETVPPSSGSTSTKVVSLKPGDKIIGYEGTQFIVRTGKVRAQAGDKGDGLPDVTGGTNINDGYAVPLNHLILLPRSDHRGLVVSSGSPEVFVMVIGGYQIDRK